MPGVWDGCIEADGTVPLDRPRNRQETADEAYGMAEARQTGQSHERRNRWEQPMPGRMAKQG